MMMLHNKRLSIYDAADILVKVSRSSLALTTGSPTGVHVNENPHIKEKLMYCCKMVGLQSRRLRR